MVHIILDGRVSFSDKLSWLPTTRSVHPECISWVEVLSWPSSTIIITFLFLLVCFHLACYMVLEFTVCGLRSSFETGSLVLHLLPISLWAGEPINESLSVLFRSKGVKNIFFVHTAFLDHPLHNFNIFLKAI